MPHVHHRYATVAGQQLFYREAGPADAPTVLLLHGFPTSSFMFRNLIPALADRYRVIAPDHLGFGLSDAPPADEFDYTFDALTDLTARLLDELGITRCAMYVQDYGAPIGFRLALRRLDAVTAIVTQNGNGYDAGFVDGFWQTVWNYQRAQTPETEAAIRQAFTLEVTRWQYLTGVPDETLVSPDALVSRLRAAEPARQRPDPAGPAARLQDEPAALPATARIPAQQRSPGAGGLGPRRRDLRPRRRACLRHRRSRC
jgi:pimeloyl-ACP methyl ester carboxylesterase